MPSTRSRRRWEWIIGAALVAQVGVAVPSVVLLQPDATKAHPQAVAHADVTRSADALRDRGIASLLAKRSRAVLSHDRAAFLGTLDPTQRAFVKHQALVFDNLKPVPFVGWRYDVDSERYRAHSSAVDAQRGTDWFAPNVMLRYQIRGYDSVATEEPQSLTFVHRGGRWLISSDSDFAKSGHETQRDLWDDGPVLVSKTSSCIALSHPAGQVMADLALAECQRAVPRVTAVWGPGWQRRVVLVVPDTPKELQKLVADIGDVSNIAAVATAELSDPSTGYHPVGDRVLVNPRNFRDLGALGRRIVITHEITHVASRAATGLVEPTWFVEGLADYVGFLHTDVPLSLSAEELRKAMRAGHIPEELPIDSDFTGGRSDLAATYEQSWLAVTLIVKKYGQARMLKLYRDVGQAESSGGVALAFATDLHTTLDAFTKTSIADLKKQLL